MQDKEATPKPTSRYMEFSKQCEEDFDALPFSLAFEQVMNDYLIDRFTGFKSQVNIPLDVDTLPPEFREVFYFPSKADLHDMTAVLSEGPDGLWAFDCGFLVDDIKYVLKSEEAGFTIQTNNADGGNINYNVDKDVVPRLLASFIVSAFDVNKEKRQGLIKDHIHDTGTEGIRQQLLELGHLIGEANSKIIAQLPYEYGDRAIFATYSESESIHATGISTKIDLAWELLDESTEFNYTSSIVANNGLSKKSRRAVTVGVTQTPIDIDQFNLSKQLPDLFDIPKQTSLSINDRLNPNWQRMAVIFMSTIAPLMDKYKYLD